MFTWSTKVWCTKAWCCTALAVALSASDLDAQGSSSGFCDSEVERVEGKSECRGQQVPCGDAGGTFTYQGLSIGSGGSTGMCCLSTIHIPDHDKKIAGDKLVWKEKDIHALLELRDCKGSGRFLFITWGSDRCELVSVVQFGAYPVLDSQACPTTPEVIES